MRTEIIPINRQEKTTSYSECEIYLDDKVNLVAVMVGVEARRCFKSLSAEESKYLQNFFQDEFEIADQWIEKHASEPVSMHTVRRNRELRILHQSYNPSQDKLASLKEFISLSSHCVVLDDELCRDSFDRIMAAHIIHADSKLSGIKKELISQRMNPGKHREFRIVAISNQTWLHLQQKLGGGMNHLSVSLINQSQYSCCMLQ